MTKKLSKSMAVMLLFATCFYAGAQQIAFPGAEGYGRFATGGRGDGETGRVVEVTTLEDDADNPIQGSLRWAFSQAVEYITHPILGQIEKKMPLTIVFKVGGVIQLDGDLDVKRNNMTIAGQTAPGDGIIIRGYTVSFGGSKNLIIRHIRFRPGDEFHDETSALRLENGGNYIIDHCSMSWGIEEVTHFSASNDLTVQYCIVSESLYENVHKKGARGYATQWGGQYASYHHNLLAHHNSRMPRINGSNKDDIEALVDYRNNVNYNWGSSGAFYGGEWEATNGDGFAKTNVVNNYFIPGPATTFTKYYARPSLNREGRELDGYADWYFSGNVMVGEPDKTNDNWLGVDGSEVGGIDNILSDIEAVQSDGALEDYDAYTETAETAMNNVLENAGATLPKRDVVDARVVAEVKGEQEIVRYPYTIDGVNTPVKGINSGLIDTQRNLVPNDAPEGTTAWDVYTTSTDGYVDSDKDGISDTWETEHGLNPNDITDGRMIHGNGYSYLENFLNGVDVTVSTTKIRVNNEFNVYPNPGNGILRVNSESVITRLEIFDLNGKKVQDIYNEGGIQSFALTQLPAGTFLIKGTGQQNQRFVQKIVVR